MDILKNKHKAYPVTEEIKPPPQEGAAFVVKISMTIEGHYFEGIGEDVSKKMARQYAAQRFLKSVFFKGHTWMDLVSKITGKDPLKEIIASL